MALYWPSKQELNQFVSHAFTLERRRHWAANNAEFACIHIFICTRGTHIATDVKTTVLRLLDIHFVGFPAHSIMPHCGEDLWRITPELRQIIFISATLLLLYATEKRRHRLSLSDRLHKIYLEENSGLTSNATQPDSEI